MAKSLRRPKRGQLKRPKPGLGLRLGELIPSGVVNPLRNRLAQTTRYVEKLRERISKERLPILGIRSQREVKYERPRKRRKSRFRSSDVTLRASANVRHSKICKQRDQRREVLFSKNVAGYGKRKSPGRQEGYRRFRTSEIGCRTRR